MFQPTIIEQSFNNKANIGRCKLCKQIKRTRCIDVETGFSACSKCFGSNLWHAQKQKKSKDTVDYTFEDLVLGVRRNVK